MKRIVILGAGESGTGAAVLAKVKGFDVFVSDFGKIAEEHKTVLSKYAIPFEEGQHTESLILNADEVVKSPGIPLKAPIIKKLMENNIPFIDELELAARYTNATKICITGSNGKTTTTLLIYHILQSAGLNVGLGGNVGKSFALQVAENNFDYYVLEISSFQLDGMFDFKAEIAILTNITPDHLDRYDYKMDNYVNSKMRILQNQTEKDVFIYCLDDEETMKALKNRNLKQQCLPFGIDNNPNGDGAKIEDNQLIITIKDNKMSIFLEQLALQGKHNRYNSMAAALSAMAVNIRDEKIRKSLSDFKNIPHRLEYVTTIYDIDFINDSKATNVNSTWYALESMHKPVIWIAGGTDKGNDYSLLTKLVRNKVKVLICLGIDNKKLRSAFADHVEYIYEVHNMKDAISAAISVANKGDAVLLSPCCASFDLFKNYEDRGDQFKQAINEL
ncbi:MAG: UDP-N-acetylmuramoyl-L-alanine--D-glutamate ligase [Bacteroidales bacterium]|nr:UDP-N-acetylmuramoyl-L-alanine--D-glutamate ligase [Bacteroidales bacterium]